MGLEKKVSQMRRDASLKIIPYMNKRTNLKLTVPGITLRVLSRTEGAYPNPKEKPESLTWKSPGPPAPRCSRMRPNPPKMKQLGPCDYRGDNYCWYQGDIFSQCHTRTPDHTQTTSTRG